MHQCMTHNRHYSTRKQFADAILAFFRETIPRECEACREQCQTTFAS